MYLWRLLQGILRNRLFRTPRRKSPAKLGRWPEGGRPNVSKATESPARSSIPDRFVSLRSEGLERATPVLVHPSVGKKGEFPLGGSRRDTHIRVDVPVRSRIPKVQMPSRSSPRIDFRLAADQSTLLEWSTARVRYRHGELEAVDVHQIRTARGLSVSS